MGWIYFLTERFIMQPVQKAMNIGSATLKHLKRASEKDNFLACLRPKSSNGGKQMDNYTYM